MWSLKVVFLCTFGAVNSARVSPCEPITVDVCSQGINYNHTRLPNALGQTRQEDIDLEVSAFTPLIATRCNKDIKLFVCSIYMPVCTVLDDTITSCRSFCQRVKNDCLPLLKNFGFDWPAAFNCSKLPEGPLCIDGGQPEATDKPQTVKIETNTAKTEVKTCDRKTMEEDNLKLRNRLAKEQIVGQKLKNEKMKLEIIEIREKLKKDYVMKNGVQSEVDALTERFDSVQDIGQPC